MAAARSGLLLLALLSPCYSFRGFPRTLRSTNDVNILVSWLSYAAQRLPPRRLPPCVPVVGAEPWLKAQHVCGRERVQCVVNRRRL